MAIALALVLAILPAGADRAAAAPASTVPWQDFLIPLPKECRVAGAIRLAPGDVGFAVPPDAAPMLTNAVAELRALYTQKSGAAPDGRQFVIHIGRLDAAGRIAGAAPADAERLQAVPYPQQAYLIRPHGTNGLLVAGLDDRGVFYGIQTLSQLLTAQLTPEAISVPLVTITDWPDFDERGTWNMNHMYPGAIPWMAAYKLNFTHIAPGIILKQDAPAECPPLPVDLMRMAKDLYAFKMNPHAPHHDFWHNAGVQTLHPEIVGQGDSARHYRARETPDIAKFQKARCPCATHPKFRELLADWIRSAARQGAEEVCLWLSEYAPQQCACENCMRDGPQQWIMETRAGIAAIQAARVEYPDLAGRIFLTLRTTPKEEEDSAACLELIKAAGLKVEKPYGRNRAVDAYAAAGNWVASYGFAVNGERARILDYLDAGYSAIVAQCNSAQDRHARGFQLLAEWTWNARGRTEFEFDRAHATRLGLPAPEQFAAWQGLARPLNAEQSRLHRTPGGTSAVVMPMLWADALTAISARQPLPKRYPPPAALTNLIAESEGALIVAKAAGAPYLIEQTLFLTDYFQAVRQLGALHAAVVDAAPGAAARAGIDREKAVLLDLLNAAAAHMEREATLRGIDLEQHPLVSRFKRFLAELTRYLEDI